MRNYLRFWLETFLLRGTQYRFFFIAVLILITVSAGGALGFYLTADFTSVQEAMWWAFLRITDPGYLGDDEGVYRRIVSVCMSICGLVLLFGSLVAIMTQWLNKTVETLELGMTPVTFSNHVVILGWSSRAMIIVAELLHSQERMHRFLKQYGESSLRVVILAEEQAHEIKGELRGFLGDLWKPGQVVFRYGNPLRIDHLKRANIAKSAAIIIPGGEFDSHQIITPDAVTVKLLLSLNELRSTLRADSLPRTVAEIYDDKKMAAAEYVLESNCKIIATDSILAQLMTQTVRHTGLSRIFTELLTDFGGNEIYIHRHNFKNDIAFVDLMTHYPKAVPIGIIRETDGLSRCELNPAAEEMVSNRDKIVLIARRFSHTKPTHRSHAVQESISHQLPMAAINSADVIKRDHIRLLILGWNNNTPRLLDELDEYDKPVFHVTLVSLTPIEHRIDELDQRNFQALNMTIEHILGDQNNHNVVTRISKNPFDRILVLSSNRTDDETASDARVALTYANLKEIYSHVDHKPPVLVEMSDPISGPSFKIKDEVIISPLLISHMLAQVSLRPELQMVFHELFGPGEIDFAFLSTKKLEVIGKSMCFNELQRYLMKRGVVAVGVQQYDSENSALPHSLNPERNQKFTFGSRDQIIILINSECA